MERVGEVEERLLDVANVTCLVPPVPFWCSAARCARAVASPAPAPPLPRPSARRTSLQSGTFKGKTRRAWLAWTSSQDKATWGRWATQLASPWPGSNCSMTRVTTSPLTKGSDGGDGTGGPVAWETMHRCSGGQVRSGGEGASQRQWDAACAFAAPKGRLIQYAIHLVDGYIIVMGPPCKYWIWMTTGLTGRWA